MMILAARASRWRGWREAMSTFRNLGGETEGRGGGGGGGGGKEKLTLPVESVSGSQ